MSRCRQLAELAIVERSELTLDYQHRRYERLPFYIVEQLLHYGDYNLFIELFQHSQRSSNKGLHHSLVHLSVFLLESESFRQFESICRLIPLRELHSLAYHRGREGRIVRKILFLFHFQNYFLSLLVLFFILIIFNLIILFYYKFL